MSSLDLIWDRLSLSDQVRVLRAEQLKILRRVGAMERKFRPNLCLVILGAMKEIASPKEWALGLIYLVLLVLFLRGTITLADLSTFLTARGGE